MVKSQIIQLTLLIIFKKDIYRQKSKVII